MASCKGTDKVINDASKGCQVFSSSVQCLHGMHWTKDSVEKGVGNPAQQAKLKSERVIPIVGVCNWGNPNPNPNCSFDKHTIDHFCDNHKNEPHCNSADLCKWV